MRLRSSVSRWLVATHDGRRRRRGPDCSRRSPEAFDQKPAEKKKPSISLRANPPVGFSPLRVVLTAEVKGGSNDYEDFYCASVEWEWGDDTKSRSQSRLRSVRSRARAKSSAATFRNTHFDRYSTDMPGSGNPTGPKQFRVKFLLKQKNKVVGSGQTVIEIRSGMGN